MKPSTRYGLVGIGALGALSLVHWGRTSPYDLPAVADYVMGVLPNLAAAIAIPFVLLSIWADQKPAATYLAARRSFVVLTLFAGLGLVAWELAQQSSRSLVFDAHDIGATVLGLGVGWILFMLLTPRSGERSARQCVQARGTSQRSSVQLAGHGRARYVPVKPPVALLMIRLAHTLVWAIFAVCIVALPVVVHAGRFDWAAALIALVALEVLVLSLNGWACPLTGLAARYTDDRRDNFDIFLPLWLARYNKHVFGTLFAGGLIYTAWQWWHRVGGI